jgi:hypothetical protein
VQILKDFKSCVLEVRILNGLRVSFAQVQIAKGLGVTRRTSSEDGLAFETPIWKRGPRASASAEDSAKLAKFFSSAVPQGRWGEAEEVAKAVLFLASDDSSYVNAVELMVDGGATGAPFGAPIFRDVFNLPGREAKSARANAE